MKLRSLKEKKKWQGQKVFLRLDLNLPRQGKTLGEDYRVRAALPTVEYLLDKGARLIIASHWGSPKPGESEWSTRPLARRLAKLSGRKVKFVPELFGKKVDKAVSELQDGEMVMIENLRFDPGEKKDDIKFARSLAALADVYVNDAFSVCHRQQASVSSLAKLLPAYAGLQLQAEVANLDRIALPKKPLVIVMGGAKIATKAPLIKKLYPKAHKILLGGGLANTFLKHQGYEIGRSLYDREADKDLKHFFSGKKLKNKILLPLDLVVSDNHGRSQHKQLNQVKKSDRILDIGPDSISAFSTYIKEAQTIVWNGPLGKFEDSPYKHGTMAIAAIIAARSTGRAFGLVGGGETVEALKMTKMQDYIDWVSTAGGAMLAYLASPNLPGLKALKK